MRPHRRIERLTRGECERERQGGAVGQERQAKGQNGPSQNPPHSHGRRMLAQGWEMSDLMFSRQCRATGF
jgi:hypothetical protein